jgi:Na+/proline symporter
VPPPAPGTAAAPPVPPPVAAPAQPRTHPASRRTAPPRRELRQRALAAAIFGLLGLIALSAANQAGHASYLVGFALIIGAAGCVLGISAVVRARRDETIRPRGSVAGIIMGAVCVVLSLLAFVGIIFARQLTSYESCMNNATTNAAQQACTQQLMRAVQTRTDQGR